MQAEELAAGVRRILERSPSLPGLGIEAVLIANPKAGGFTRRRIAARRQTELAELCRRAEALPLRPEGATLRLHLTDRAGHATELAESVFARARASGYPPALRILMTAGGDGTSLETMTALMALPAEERARWAVLRLPLGTGNDGSEGRDLTAALGRFLGPARLTSRRGIRCLPNPGGGKAGSWSFNIASIGFDAFVTNLTNRLKTALPGDSYKLWVDLTSVFYDRLFKVRPLSVRAFGPNGRESLSFERPCLLLAFGASGNRQYGSNKPILPDADNVCAVFQMPLFRKLALKGPIAAGKHRGIPEAALFSAERVVLGYGERVLMQRDGEATELGPADFPFAFERSSESYSVIEPA